MELSTKRLLFKIAGIWLFVMLGFCVISLIGLTFAFDALIASFETMTGVDLSLEFQDYDLILTVLKIVLIALNWINAMLYIVFGAFFIKRAGLSQQELEERKTSTVVWSVIVAVFVSLIPGILGLIAGVAGMSEREKLDEAKQAETQKQIFEPENSEVAKKIAEIKKLKQSGAISDQEYEKLLSEIIE